MSAKLPLYKKTPTTNTRTREMLDVDTDERTEVMETLSTFVQLFKDKYL